MAEVLYRKWRPRSLDDVVGQSGVTNTLKRAVTSGRLAHAYLFCGPRGTGKTSTARILAKAVNCLSPIDGEPDNACNRCSAIDEGRALDLIEIDAASNRGIDDIRDLSNKIGFAPTEFTYKVYIVDEVHMLTDAAFNALLKTLEEPPGHALFILATTEVHKVPLTIVSRCQRYDFRRIQIEAIGNKLLEICDAERVDATPEAIDLIARHSTGSLRDAENILEQAVVSYGSPLVGDQVRDMLELTGDEDALDLCELVVNRQVPEGLDLINRLSAQGADLRQLQRGLVGFLRAVMLVASGVGDSTSFSDTVNKRVSQIASGGDRGQVIHSIKIFVEADVRLDQSSPLPLELALVESATIPTAPETSTPRPAVAPARSPAPSPAGQAGYRQAASSRPPRATAVRERSSPPPAPQPAVSAPSSEFSSAWPALLRALQHTGSRFKLGPLLRSSRGYSLDGNRIVVKFAHGTHIERIEEEIANPAVRQQLNEAISQTLGGDYELGLELMSGTSGPDMRQANQSHLVRAAQAMGARLVEKVEEVSGS